MTVTEQKLTFLSSDGRTTIHCKKWIPEGEVKAVLQIAHGMSEYVDRYGDFARYMAENGVLTVGNDHLGHGDSVVSEEEKGYFKQPDGMECVLSDMDTLRKNAECEYPGVPYFILGHSMGSFYTRVYISRRGEGLAGAVVMGTGRKSDSTLKAGMALCRTIAAKKGWHYRSKFVHAMSMGANDKRFGKPRTFFDWLNRDPEAVDRYIADEKCGFMFTLDGFYQMFRVMREMMKKTTAENTPVMPVLFISGNDDPIGDFGKGVKKTFDEYLENGKKAEILLYDGVRHEVLNDPEHERFYADIKNWLERNI